ncbi:Serine/threonine protein kinase [Rhodococcoides kroppenstedtii]|uniref:non-specific serine/threonine protein kinase n=1 Tax=Rhodococcoides kroppenstedtii TaxID=293050 RepID=A0A1I0TXL5_9NOCA|nr:NERD domain-containing protein [Rhodococcus kroppenstedtii]SFA56417.1 Serine/threonine protein kinase [Rhodococcus kroppenstedtii]
MAYVNDRWVEVSKSAFAHETAGLELIRTLLPNSSPYRAWTNFEFMDNHGQWHEIDALVLGRRRLHLVELKSYTGVLQGNENSWVRTTPGGRTHTQRSPLLITRRKAQRLATRIEEEARKVAVENGLDPEKVRRALPFVQESVFLHGSPFTTDLSDLAKSSLFGPDGSEQKTGLPGLSNRLLEPPTDSRRVDEDLSVIIALALKNLGISRRTERDAGSWTITGTPIASGEDWQEWPAKQKVTQELGRARIVSLRRGTPANARDAAYRKFEREYSLLSALRHESIVAPRDLVQDDDGNTVIVYPETPGYEPLDLALTTRSLTAEQQLRILTDISEAVGYAHRNSVAHRGLGPSTVLIHTEKLDKGQISVRLADWSWAGRVHSGDTRAVTVLGTSIATGTAPSDDVYQAPEDRWAVDGDRMALDVFSLGALAYFLLSGGQPPARDRGALLERLRRENGLDLAASGGRFVDEQVRALVLRATHPAVTKRVGTDPKSGQPSFGAQQFASELNAFRHRQLPAVELEIDPLNPTPGALLSGRFEVVKVLGSGSTARGVLVQDRNHDDALRVLKIGLDDSAVDRLRDEAEVLSTIAALAPPVPGVVTLFEGPLDLAENRVALLLSHGGDQTLADVVRYTPLGEAQLERWGKELLDTVVALDAAGITHRDIKPANLGLARTEGKPRGSTVRLALFDFSLSRASVDQLDAGTPPYRDPFLGSGLRTAFDSSAERYSVGVVLFEMATASTPQYGDGISDPGALQDEVTVAPEMFTAGGLSRSRAEALVDFFRTALARDARSRFETSSAMRDAWTAVFAANTKPNGRPTNPAKPSVPRASDSAPASITSLRNLMSEFVKTAGAKPATIRRQVVELVLGSHAQAPDDAFVTYQELASLVGVTSGRVAQIFGDFDSIWAKNPALDTTVRDLIGRMTVVLESSGGASTPDLLARELIRDMSSEGVDRPGRAGFGLVRLLLASQGSTVESDDGVDHTLHMIRRRESRSVAMIATAAIPRRLPAALAAEAERLVTEAASQGIHVVGPPDAETSLRAVAAGVLDVAPFDIEIPGHVLVRIATAGSAVAALSARDELHSRTLRPDDSLGILLRGLSTSDSFDRSELESRLAARFPALTDTVPRRPGLDALVGRLVPGLHWDEAARRYVFGQAPNLASHVPTRHTRTAVLAHQAPGTDHLDAVLRASIQDRTFRALGVPLGSTDEVAAALVSLYGALHIDVTELLLTHLRGQARKAAISWANILAADAGAANDRSNLRGFVADSIPVLLDAVNDAGAPVVLTDLSTLAAYGQLGVLRTWADLSSPPTHAIWALIPQRPESGGLPGSVVDGVPMALNSPEQFVQFGRRDVASLLTRTPSTSPASIEETS